MMNKRWFRLSALVLALVMLFAGIVLMIPAAIVVMWRMAQIVAPQLTHSPKPESLSDREKRNDADH